MSRPLDFLRGNVLVLTLCSTIWRVSVGIVWPFLSLYVLALGGRYGTIGLVMAVGNFAGMLLYPLGGYIADRHGRIKIMAYMTYIYAVTFLLFILAPDWRWIAIGMFLQSLVTFYIPAMQALMADSLPPERRGVGFATMMAIPSAAGIASPMIGGWLIETYGMERAMRWLYASGFAAGLIVATLRLRFLRETVEGERSELSLRRVPDIILSAYRSIPEVLREAPRGLLTLSLLVSGCVFFTSIASPFWVVKAYEEMGITADRWGLLMFLAGLVNVASSIPAGSLIDRLSRRWVAGLSLLLSAPPILLFLWARSFLHLLLVTLPLSLLGVFINPAIQALFADLTPRRMRGRVMASIGGGGFRLMGGAWGSGVLTTLTATLGSLCGGYLYELNSALPWYLLSASSALLGGLLIILLQEPERVEA